MEEETEQSCYFAEGVQRDIHGGNKNGIFPYIEVFYS